MLSYKDIEKASLFIFGLFLITAYIPGIIGASLPTGWLFLVLIIPFTFFYTFKITVNNILGMLFIVYTTLSLVWTQNFNIATFYLYQLLLLACVFCIGSVIDIRVAIKGLLLGLGISDIVAFIQYFKKEPVVYTLPDSVAGLFINQNIFCEISVVLLVCAIVFKLWAWIPFTLPGIVLVHSRAALLGLGVALAIWIWRFNKWLLIGLALAGLGYLSIIKFNSASIFERFGLYKDTLRGLTFFGNGIGSFEILYPLYAIDIDTSLARPKYAHNDLLQLIFEFGIGAITPVLMILNLLRTKAIATLPDAKIIIYVLITISMFTYPLHTPINAFIWLLVSGYINRDFVSFQFSRISWGSNLSLGAERR